MIKCNNCGSLDVVHTEDYQAYFREGDYIRLRMIHVWNNVNDNERMFYASCPELSKSTVVEATDRLIAMKSLGESLKRMKNVELLGNKLEVSYD